MARMRLLVTGGAGFIGSNFIRYWLRQHPEDVLVNLDLLTYAGDLATVADIEGSWPEKYSFVRGDIADPVFVGGVINQAQPDLLCRITELFQRK